MTVEQRLQWITLPNGASDDRESLLLSVFVAPQLRTDEGTTLAAFPDLLDWPARLLAPGTDFQFELADGTLVGASRTSADPDSALWQAMFNSSTPLRPFDFDDYADRPIVSYSAGAVLDAVRGIYAAVAASDPGELPAVRRSENERRPGLIDLFTDVCAVSESVLGDGVEDESELNRRIGDLLSEARAEARRRRSDPTLRGGLVVEPLMSDGTTAGEFARLLLFHRRPAEPVEFPDRREAVAHFAASVDFHQMLAALGDHPALLRLLGLVLDFTVPADAVPDTGHWLIGNVRVRPTWRSQLAPNEHTNVLRWTAYRRLQQEGETFFAAPQRMPNPAAPPGAPPLGLLPLPPGTFEVQQIDIDGTGLKALNLASTLNRIAGRTDAGEEPLGETGVAGLPSIRAGGLALVHKGRAEALQESFIHAWRQDRSVEEGASMPLLAEDLVRGYRLDVWDDAVARWASLHERVSTYGVATYPATLDPVADEGMFQLSLAEPLPAAGVTPDPAAELYVHEHVVTWDGWSLSAPRPGKPLGASQPEPVANDALTAMGLSIEVSARPGTLPRLRFGRRYRIRVRTVDLAGNGPTLKQADRRLELNGTDTPVLPLTRTAPYLRFEPVPPPALVPRARFAEGSSVLRLVVRSDADQTPEQYAEAFNASAYVTEGEHPPYQSYDDRHVAAPKASLQLVELHGLLDRVIGSDGSDPDRARLKAIRNTYEEIALREKGSFDDSRGGEVVEIDTHDDAGSRQRYVIQAAEQLHLPFLPDPLAIGAAFFGLPGQPEGEPFLIDFAAPPRGDPLPLRLRVVGGDAAPEWEEGSRLLTVSLPQAAKASVRVASLFGGDISEMGIVQWCLEVLDSTDADRVMTAVRENRSWLVTPWHEIELVHAVQRPLSQPVFERLEVDRWPRPGATDADLFGFVRLHVPSTESVDLLAEWKETVDDPQRPEPQEQTAEASVFTLPLSNADEYSGWGPEDAPCTLVKREGDGHATLTFNSNASVAPGADLDNPASHVFGDTKHRSIAYRIRATTPFRDCFPTTWAKRPVMLCQTSEAFEIEVPSSAPPAPPRILGVVPTQGWERDGDSNVQRRLGGGLRVWMDRGWFSSGDGELLAVVLAPVSGILVPNQPLYPYVTLLGRDPIRTGGPLRQPTTSMFSGPPSVGTARALLVELDEGVDLVCYEPAYVDEIPNRWFCDIDIDTGLSYFPFVRLSLARYQPHSMYRCDLSPVVLADIVQTLPDRVLTVTREPDKPGMLHLELSGPTYTSIRGPDGIRSDQTALGRVVASVEQRDPRIVDDLLAWREIHGSEIELHRTLYGSTAVWSGTLDVSAYEAATTRVRVIERDYLATDEEIADPNGLSSRVVYADVIRW